MKPEDIEGFVIIGGGFAGLANAYMIEDSLLFEEHNIVGYPPHCTGIVSSRFVKILGSIAVENIMNIYKGIKVLDLNGSEILNLRFTDRIYRLDRINLERMLLKEAIDRGSRVELGSKILSLEEGENNEICLVIDRKNTLFRRCLKNHVAIISDGVNGIISKKIIGNEKRDLLLGIQGLAPIKRYDMADIDEILVFIDDKLFPGFFGWIVPVSEKRAIAGAGFSLKTSTSIFFRYFLYRLKKIGVVEEARAASLYGGIIVRSFIKRNIMKRYIIAGDAAGLTKPFTGGGLYTSLYQALSIRNSIDRDIDRFRKSYENNMKGILSELYFQRMATKIAERLGVENILRKYVVRYLGRTLYIDYDYHSSVLRRIISR
ncbi:MAG: NAD(P)/FAD-dependent oxidoreductase [Sulfolobales archaeon]